MKSKGTKILIVVLVILILVAGGVMAYKIVKSKEKVDLGKDKEELENLKINSIQIKNNQLEIKSKYDSNRRVLDLLKLDSKELINPDMSYIL